MDISSMLCSSPDRSPLRPAFPSESSLPTLPPVSSIVEMAANTIRSSPHHFDKDVDYLSLRRPHSSSAPTTPRDAISSSTNFLDPHDIASWMSFSHLAAPSAALTSLLPNHGGGGSNPTSPMHYSNNDNRSPSPNTMMMLSPNSVNRPRRMRKKREGLICHRCKTSKTPEWRKGPNGPRTLCNACGLQYAKQVRKAKEQDHQEKVVADILLQWQQMPTSPMSAGQQEDSPPSVDASSPPPFNPMASPPVVKAFYHSPSTVAPKQQSVDTKPLRDYDGWREVYPSGSISLPDLRTLREEEEQ